MYAKELSFDILKVYDAGLERGAPFQLGFGFGILLGSGLGFLEREAPFQLWLGLRLGVRVGFLERGTPFQLGLGLGVMVRVL